MSAIHANEEKQKIVQNGSHNDFKAYFESGVIYCIRVINQVTRSCTHVSYTRPSWPSCTLLYTKSQFSIYETKYFIL